MTQRAADRPGDRINDKTLLAAFKDSLDAAKRSGTPVMVARSHTDFETLRWVDDAWECVSVRRGSNVIGVGS